MSKTLSGKVAVVTGASKGIGAAIARHLGRAGASVVVNYASSREGAERVVRAIEADGGQAVAAGANVAQPEEIGQLFDAAQAKFGRLDILVNNAGIYRMAALGAITPEHYHEQFDLNVLGLILATQQAVEHFGPAGGSVINISSVVSTHPFPTGMIYSATKAAVDSITRTMAMELGPRQIRVNAINPGPVETEGSAGNMEMFRPMIPRTPLGRLGQPDDIAEVAVFLASDAARWVNGEILRAAGGFIAG